MAETAVNAGEVAASTMGLNSSGDMPWWMETSYNALGNLPGLAPTMGFSIFRTKNTIQRGGWSPDDPKGRYGSNKSRKGWTRFSSNNVFTPERNQRFGSTKNKGFLKGRQLAGGVGKVFDPYQSAGAINWAGRLGGKNSAVNKMAARYGPVSQVVSGGFMGQMSAAQGLARGGAVGNSYKWAMEMDSHATAKFRMGSQGMSSAALNAGQVRNVRGGLINQAFGGAVQAAQFGQTGVGVGGRTVFTRAGTHVAKDLAGMGIKEGMGVGVRQAAGSLKLGTKNIGTRYAAGAIGKKAAVLGGTRLAAYAGLAAAGGPVGTGIAAVWMAYDMMKLGATLGKDLASGTARLVSDGAKSWKGNIDKSPFGMDFKDTESASTSRSRGVAAIQNSRLNGRSILGSEAGAMAAMYG